MRLFAAIATAGALGAVTVLTATASAQGDSAPAATQSSLVEDYQHPNQDGAAAVGMTLKNGNGKIFWLDCAVGGDLVVVESDSITTPNHFACFKVTGPGGYLALKVPSTYFIKGDSHKIEATLTAQVDGREVTQPPYTIKSGEFTPVGETVHEDQGPAALVEIRSLP
ncbi:hypothetical protein AB5J62_22970 [Amycolatopsis sp. cg5]|uniref:hypothetical protein n=1 Tax=Amycolatopsis sp. cg5 TaxID=3238802 RepID=UPI0035242A8F